VRGLVSGSMAASAPLANVVKLHVDTIRFASTPRAVGDRAFELSDLRKYSDIDLEFLGNVVSSSLRLRLVSMSFRYRNPPASAVGMRSPAPFNLGTIDDTLRVPRVGDGAGIWAGHTPTREACKLIGFGAEWNR
jgi:hypothetical protein